MQGKGSAFCGSATSLEVRYTGKPVSGWGGLVAVMRYLEKRGVRQVLAQALPDGRTSPNQIPVLDIALALFATVLTGGRRNPNCDSTSDRCSIWLRTRPPK